MVEEPVTRTFGWNEVETKLHEQDVGRHVGVSKPVTENHGEICSFPSEIFSCLKFHGVNPGEMFSYLKFYPVKPQPCEMRSIPTSWNISQGKHSWEQRSCCFTG